MPDTKPTELESATPTPKPIKKKKYSPPTLTDYGTVRDITNAVGNMGQSDGGVSPRIKTNV